MQKRLGFRASFLVYTSSYIVGFVRICLIAASEVVYSVYLSISGN